MAEAAAFAMDTPSDSLTPAEQAYFESGGENTEGLVDAEPAQASVEPKEAEVKAPDSVEAKDGKAAPEAAEGELEPAEGDDPPKGKTGVVPHGALHAEREKRKATEAALIKEQQERQAEREQRARLEERLNLINEALSANKQQPKEDVPPNPEEDIFGYAKWQAKQIEDLRKTVTEQGQFTQAQQGRMQLQAAYQADAINFVQQTPDFRDAYQFILQSRDRELALIGYDDPRQRAEMIAAEEMGIAERMLRAGKSPAQQLYELAKARGFAKAAEPPAIEKSVDVAPPATNGKAPDAPDPASIAKTIEKIKEGQAAAKTLSGGGGPGDGPLTAEALLEMDEKEFQVALKKLTAAEQRQLFGA